MKIFEAIDNQTERFGFSLTRSEGGAIAVLALIAIYAAALLAASGSRVYFGYGTETDFVGSMIGEAQRLLAGHPLESQFHPPGYTFVLAATYSLTGDWFAAGKLISGISGIIAILATYQFFVRLSGPETGAWLGLGAVAGYLCSSVFLAFSAQATSDIYFLSLLTLAMLTALVAMQRTDLATWGLCGALVALAAMTRTNGITLMLLLALPLFQPRPVIARIKSIAAAGLAASLVVLAFVAFASATSSNLFPEGTYKNLAASYFSSERVSWEGIVEAGSKFDSLAAVLLHDPLAIAQQYVKDLAKLVLFGLPKVASPVLVLLAVPGLFFFIKDRPGLPFMLFATITAVQVGLVNFKAFEPRLYMFVLPWIGAAAAYAIFRLGTSRLKPHLRWTAIAILAALVTGSFTLAAGQAAKFATQDNSELASAVPEVSGLADAHDTIVARKPHLSFYSAANFTYLPQAAIPSELRHNLAEVQARTPGAVYLFWGRIESDLRPEIAAMLATPGRTPWLVPAAGNRPDDGWTLYRYEPDRTPGSLRKPPLPGATHNLPER